MWGHIREQRRTASLGLELTTLVGGDGLFSMFGEIVRRGRWLHCLSCGMSPHLY
jgi:hypothetical protein